MSGGVFDIFRLMMGRTAIIRKTAARKDSVEKSAEFFVVDERRMC